MIISPGQDEIWSIVHGSFLITSEAEMQCNENWSIEHIQLVKYEQWNYFWRKWKLRACTSSSRHIVRQTHGHNFFPPGKKMGKHWMHLPGKEFIALPTSKSRCRDSTIEIQKWKWKSIVYDCALSLFVRRHILEKQRVVSLLKKNLLQHNVSPVLWFSFNFCLCKARHITDVLFPPCFLFVKCG